MFKNLKKEYGKGNDVMLVRNGNEKGGAMEKVLIKNVPDMAVCTEIDHMFKESKHFTFGIMWICFIITFAVFVYFMNFVCTAVGGDYDTASLPEFLAAIGGFIVLASFVWKAGSIAEKAIIVRMLGKNGKYACLRDYCNHVPIGLPNNADIEAACLHLKTFSDNVQKFYSFFANPNALESYVDMEIHEHKASATVSFKCMYSDKAGDLHKLKEKVECLDVVENVNLADGEYEIDFAGMTLRTPKSQCFA